MALLTMVTRVVDGMPLAASVQEDEQVGRGLLEYQNQAKALMKKLDYNSPARCSIETGSYVFHYLMDRDVCYLILCDRSFPKRMAFSFLEEIMNEFQMQYGHKVQKATRPYSFIQFDTFIQKAKRNYMDSRSRRNLTNVNSELQDVQRIMVQNINDVLTRGEALSALDDKASNLSSLSQKYRKDARYLNLKSTWMKVVAILVVLLILIVYVRYWWWT